MLNPHGAGICCSHSLDPVLARASPYGCTVWCLQLFDHDTCLEVTSLQPDCSRQYHTACVRDKFSHVYQARPPGSSKNRNLAPQSGGVWPARMFVQSVFRPPKSAPARRFIDVASVVQRLTSTTGTALPRNCVFIAVKM